MSLNTLIPDVRALLSLAPEELAFQVLQLARSQTQGGKIRFELMKNQRGLTAPPTWGFGAQHEDDVEVAATEAWRWLEMNLFILPAPGTNGRNGWFVLGRRARTALAEQAFADYRRA